MRYALLSDVHGNLHALEAVIEALTVEHVDAVLCAGDLVGYGPAPNECVRLLASLPAVGVAGNHDLMALGLLSDERCSSTVRATQRWTRGVLDTTTRKHLSALPRQVILPDVVLAHGSLEDPTEYVSTPAQAVAQLTKAEQVAPGTRLLVLGHTHRPWAFSAPEGTTLEGTTGVVHLNPNTSYLLNPGSVGQSRDRSPLARFAVLDLERRHAEFRAVEWDLRGCRRELRRQGLPPAWCFDRRLPAKNAARRMIHSLTRHLAGDHGGRGG